MAHHQTSKIRVHTLKVSHRGERQFFQVKLPADARRIVAVYVHANPAKP